ncbi:polysaccharide biosynthesis tyrosine autokinase [Pseudonocardia sp.]|uniref:polysaccharide biosynthesis tyrosine autokinase n=1 Tax=Pseudonocardia sp. TaxID=60912 RepID=UPI003D1248B2
MTPRQYLDILRARWRIVVACFVLGILAAVGITLITPQRYSSEVSIYLAAQTPAGDPGAAVDGGDLVRQRVSTYLEIISSQRLADEVAQQLGGTVTADLVRSEISATSEPDSTLITAVVTDDSAQRAADVANAVAARFAATVVELETPPGTTGPPLVTAQVFQAAQPATSPSSPDPVTNVVLGALIGLLVGCGLAVLRHVLDTSVKSREQVRELLGVPVLGEIQADPGFDRTPLMVETAPATRAAECFRQLRTNLQFLDVDRNRRVWLVTSPTPGAGKTTTVANLALALAEAGGRVLVVEADLRRPRVAELLGVDRAIGLTNVLVRRMPGGQAVQRIRPGLDVLASGPLPPNPSEVLGSAAMAGLLTQARDRYDVVLVDASPLSPVTDAAAVARQVDGVLLVVPYGRVTRQQVRVARETLETVSAPLLGAVLTRTPAAKHRKDGPDAAYLAVRSELDVPAGERPLLAPAWTRPGEPPRTNGAMPGPSGGPNGGPARPAPVTTAIPRQSMSVAGSRPGAPVDGDGAHPAIVSAPQTAGPPPAPAAGRPTVAPTATSVANATQPMTSAAVAGASEEAGPFAAARAPKPVPDDGNGRKAADEPDEK